MERAVTVRHFEFGTQRTGDRSVNLQAATGHYGSEGGLKNDVTAEHGHCSAVNKESKAENSLNFNGEIR